MPIGRGSVVEINDDFKATNVLEVLASYRSILTEAITRSLVDVDRYASGELSKSIRVEIQDDYGQFIFELYMDDYWKFVDKGVDGTITKHGSPYSFKKKNISRQAMRSFMMNRGIDELIYTNKKGEKVTYKANNTKSIKRKTKGLDNKERRKEVKKQTVEDRRNSIAFALGRSISRKGVKPTHFLSNVVSDEFKIKFKEHITKAFEEDIIISVREIKEQLNG